MILSSKMGGRSANLAPLRRCLPLPSLSFSGEEGSSDCHQIDGSSLMGPDKPVTTLEWWKDEDLAAHFTRDEPLEKQERAERRGPRWRAPCGRTGGDGGRGGAGNADM